MTATAFRVWTWLCGALGGHQYRRRWQRVPRLEGGVDLVERVECTRCPESLAAASPDLEHCGCIELAALKEAERRTQE